MTKKNALMIPAIIFTAIMSATAFAAEEQCFETKDGMEVCIKQKANAAGEFTQEDANQLAEVLPKLTGKQLSALKVLLQSQKGEKVSNEDVQELITSLPKLPDEFLEALTLYAKSSEGKTIKPEEIQNLINNTFEIPDEYQDALKSALKLVSEKGDSEAAAMNLFSELLKASDAPNEIGDAVQSYFKMVNQDDKESEEQFLKAGMGLLKLIVKATKEPIKETPKTN